MVLVEEELVVIDLQTPGWPTIPAPYLAPLHSSAITCSYHISNVPLKLWERIISAGEQQSPRLSSVVSWEKVHLRSQKGGKEPLCQTQLPWGRGPVWWEVGVRSS